MKRFSERKLSWESGTKSLDCHVPKKTRRQGIDELKRLLRRREVNRKGFVVRDDAAVKMAEEPLGNRKGLRKGLRIHALRGRILLGEFYRTVRGGACQPAIGELNGIPSRSPATSKSHLVQ